MTGGIHISPGQNVVLNGIDVQRCVDIAVTLAQGRRAETKDSDSAELLRVAGVGAQTLRKVRSAGYSKDICRDALWAKIIDEAQRAKA